MVFKDGKLLMSYGVMGGDIQAQGHAQVLINLIDRGLNLQQAIDAPRVRYISGRGVMMEDGLTRSGDRRPDRARPRAGAAAGRHHAPGADGRRPGDHGRSADRGAGRGLRHQEGWTRHWLLDPVAVAAAVAAGAAAFWGSSARVAARVDPADTKLLTQPAVSASHLAFIYAGDLFVSDLTAEGAGKTWKLQWMRNGVADALNQPTSEVGLVL